MPKSQEEVLANLSTIWPNIKNAGGVVDSWCKVGSFLSDGSKVLEFIDRLDVEMAKALHPQLSTQEYAIRAYRQKVIDDKKLDQNTKNIPDYGHGLLRTVLDREESKMGFNKARVAEDLAYALTEADRLTPGLKSSNREHKTPTLVKFFEPADFMRLLREKTHWKDPGAEPLHGEFTHRIQWYALSCVFKTLTSDIFASIGKSFDGSLQSTEDRFSYVSKNPAGYTLTLWDALCDRTNKEDVSFRDEVFAVKEILDFRSPENLNKFLKKSWGYNDCRWPLLHEFLNQRFVKRSQPRFDTTTYIAQKLFAKSYAECDAEQQALIDKLNSGKGAVYF